MSGKGKFFNFKLCALAMQLDEKTRLQLFRRNYCSDDPSYRDFTTMAAVNSIVGFKSFPVLVRRGMIIARQLGYKTPAVMESEIRRLTAAEKGKPSPKIPRPLTTQQLRDTLDRLEDQNLLKRCQASRTCVYFSTTMSIEDLRAAVKKKVEGWNRVASRREIDRAIVQGAK